MFIYHHPTRNFMTQFDKLLAESMMPISRHNVIELRALYYGRLYIYVAFTDQGDYDFSGYDGSTLKRPYGILCLPVNDVVGRHTNNITTNKYANVFRYQPDDTLDELSYSRQNLSDDMDILSTLDYLDDKTIEQAKEQASTLSQVTAPFSYLMNLTQYISSLFSLSDRLWRRIIADLGYDTIVYRNKNVLVLGYDDRQDLDIIPYETFKPENRMYVRKKIDKKNKLMWMQRNRYAKERTDKTRPLSGDQINEPNKIGKTVNDVIQIAGMQ